MTCFLCHFEALDLKIKNKFYYWNIIKVNQKNLKNHNPFYPLPPFQSPALSYESHSPRVFWYILVIIFPGLILLWKLSWLIFDMSNLGLMHFFSLVLKCYNHLLVFYFPEKYVEILDKYKMKKCNSICTPTEYGLSLVKNNGKKKVDATLYKQIVGSLMYLASTRPDIMHSVS